MLVVRVVSAIVVSVSAPPTGRQERAARMAEERTWNFMVVSAGCCCADKSRSLYVPWKIVGRKVLLPGSRWYRIQKRGASFPHHASEQGEGR